LTIRAVGSALRFAGRMLPCPKIVERLAENGTSAKTPPMDQDISPLRGFAICTAPRSGSNFLS
jgi:hypothetical protein